MLRDVKTTVTDGGLGIRSNTGTVAHFKIGVSAVVSAEPIIIKGSMNTKQIKAVLGLSPLADAAMDSVENGSNLIYCIPVTPSVNGTVGAITKTGTGTGECTTQGNPNNAYEIIVRFTGAGGFNLATLRYSIDGGYSFAEEVTLPLDGQLVIPDTGLTLKFTEAAIEPTESFAVGDEYKLSTEAPQMTNQDVLTAIDKLRTTQYEFEYVHIVGESVKALWSAVSVEIKSLHDVYKKPIFAVMEVRRPTSEETLDQYVQYLINERKGIDNYDLQIVAARSVYMRMDGVTKEINNAGIVCGLYSKANVQQSIGETKSFSISEDKMVKLLPEGIEDYISILDTEQYLTFRPYEGLAGYYVTNARMMAPEGSDYRYAEHVRVKNKMIRETRKEALKQLQTEVDMEDVEGSLDAIAKFIQIPLDEMTRKKEISSARIMLADDLNILVDEILKVKILFVPKGYIREFEIDLGMENPFITQ